MEVEMEVEMEEEMEEIGKDQDVTEMISHVTTVTGEVTLLVIVKVEEDQDQEIEEVEMEVETEEEVDLHVEEIEGEDQEVAQGDLTVVIQDLVVTKIEEEMIDMIAIEVMIEEINLTEIMKVEKIEEEEI